MIRQYELVEIVKAYDPDADEDLLNRAYVYAMQCHGSQTRASGDPYFSHPLEVAGILTEMKLDVASICTALLHDTVEDTEATLDSIEKNFGSEIARLVDGVTKLTRLELQSENTKQAENFRKLVLAMSEDIRVLLVKLADRTHNMRTLYHIQKPEKRARIARETLDIYSPLAERIGIHQMKDELDDLAFKELYPDARESILARLAFLRSEGENLVQEIMTELKDLLTSHDIVFDLNGREKTPFSIWKKMQRKNIAFEQLSDIMAFRLYVGSISDCYAALGYIHAEYSVVPGRFKDYISTPKPNGYQSLHTTVIGPEKQRIEVQIRTREMHEVAELGVAAHWEYKQGGGRKDGRQYRWMRELLDILEHAQKPEEFLEHTKLELFQDQVFCFSPRGDLINLPTGATPVDFAYAVHSEVGDKTVGAKVNGLMVPLRTQLSNGDQVEIITSKTQTPSPTWERFVVTGKARARIRRFIRSQQRQQYADLGKAMLQKVWRQEGYEYNEKAFDPVLSQFQSATVEDLYASVGSGLKSAKEIFNTVYPSHNQPVIEHEEDKIVHISNPRTKSNTGKDKPLAIKGLIPGMAVHYAGCCHPLPGDRIVGIVTTGKGVTIHTIDCETLESFADQPERWLDVGWNDGRDEPTGFVGRLQVIVSNEPGSLGDVSTVIGKNGGNITNLKMANRNVDFFELLLDIDVVDVKHLSNIIAALRTISVIQSVERARGR